MTRSHDIPEKNVTTLKVAEKRRARTTPDHYDSFVDVRLPTGSTLVQRGAPQGRPPVQAISTVGAGATTVVSVARRRRR
jgi:hypothetical protein